MKRLNTYAKGNPQTSKFTYGTFNPTKFGRTEGTLGSNPRNKSIQCREYGGYGHIQVEYDNTNKNQSFLAT